VLDADELSDESATELKLALISQMAAGNVVVRKEDITLQVEPGSIRVVATIDLGDEDAGASESSAQAAQTSLQAMTAASLSAALTATNVEEGSLETQIAIVIIPAPSPPPSPLLPPPLPPPLSPAASPAEPLMQDGDESVGLIAGAAAGGAVALLVVASVAFLWYKRHVAIASKAPTIVSIASPSADFSASASASASAVDVELKEDVSQVQNDRYV